jgi:hypothetical protein
MEHPTDNETWIVETGALVLEKEACSGRASWSPWERLVYCLWVADYGMRNAGDLEAAADVHPDFHSEAQRLAKELSLRTTYQAFSLSRLALEREYFERFEAICDEIRSAE